MSWFQVGIGGWIYQNCPKHFRIFHRPSSVVACMHKEWFFSRVLRFFIRLQNYVNSELDKSEMLMNRILSRNMEYFIFKYSIFFDNILFPLIAFCFLNSTYPVCIYMCMCVCVCVYTHMYWVCFSMYIYVCIHIHTHTYIYIYIERERERDVYYNHCPTL